ncbi:MAG: hypothetical protein ACD_45C00750G0007 [uncultured bacterium]|nr:MAG: hypothetical protein ACD_45C00750G0007 [uncultured bacterium]
MNKYILIFKKWYELRATREKVWIAAFGWALLYAIFYFFSLGSLDKQTSILGEGIKKTNHQIKSWNIQISALKQMSESPLYKQWTDQKQRLEGLRGKYQNFLQTNLPGQWQEIIKNILGVKQDNIHLVQIKDFPETVYKATEHNEKTNLYQKTFRIVVNGNFFDTVSYLQQLEKLRPNVHWDSLNYQVVQYPIAKVEMEFSIFYEKNT